MNPMNPLESNRLKRRVSIDGGLEGHFSRHLSQHITNMTARASHPELVDVQTHGYQPEIMYTTVPTVVVCSCENVENALRVLQGVSSPSLASLEPKPARGFAG